METPRFRSSQALVLWLSAWELVEDMCVCDLLRDSCREGVGSTIFIVLNDCRFLRNSISLPGLLWVELLHISGKDEPSVICVLYERFSIWKSCLNLRSFIKAGCASPTIGYGISIISSNTSCLDGCTRRVDRDLRRLVVEGYVSSTGLGMLVPSVVQASTSCIFWRW